MGAGGSISEIENMQCYAVLEAAARLKRAEYRSCSDHDILSTFERTTCNTCIYHVRQSSELGPHVVLSLSMETEHTGSRTIYIGIESIDYSSGHMVLQCWDAALLAGSSF